jgi:hypothetical protein
LQRSDLATSLARRYYNSHTCNSRVGQAVLQLNIYIRGNPHATCSSRLISSRVMVQFGKPSSELALLRHSTSYLSRTDRSSVPRFLYALIVLLNIPSSQEMNVLPDHRCSDSFIAVPLAMIRWCARSTGSYRTQCHRMYGGRRRMIRIAYRKLVR